MRHLTERLHLVDRVERAELGGLCDRDHPGLDVVLVAECMGDGLDVLGPELAVGGGDVDELGPDEPLGRARLVDVDVGRLGAHHGLRRPDRRGQRKDVGAGASPHEQHLGVHTEQVPEHLGRLRCPPIGAVGEGMPLVGVEQRLHDRGMDARRVVAGERSPGGGEGVQRAHGGSLARAAPDGHVQPAADWHDRSESAGARRRLPGRWTWPNASPTRART